MTTSLDPLSLLGALVLEDGQPWGSCALDWQTEDAQAILDPAAASPRRHYLLRGRGMSKTTDTAALALVLLICQAPARSRSYCYAVDAEQAGLFMDALAGLAERSGLAGLLDIGARLVTVRATGASLSVESSDGASAYGSRPWLVVCDELSMWPSTANHRRLWGAVVSALPKVPQSRLVVIGTAGSPTGLGAKVWEEAVKSEHWHTSRRPGPSPWWSPEDIASTRADLTAAEWRRLILCEWAEGDDALTNPDDVTAAIRPGSTTLDPRPGVQYVAALDVGTRRDLTALVVGHVERRPEGRVVVIDLVRYWRPTPGTDGRVDLAEVEAVALRICRTYSAKLRFDRMQAEQLTANLTRQGVRTDEYVFSAAGANRLARSVYVALRDRALSLPDDPEVREEFLTARLVETGPGTVKLQNPPGAHDDIVTAVGMVVTDLLERPEIGACNITVPAGRRLPPRATGSAALPMSARTATPSPQQLRRVAREGPRGLAGGPILMKGTANDPE